MSKPLNNRLSSMDAMFLYFEKPDSQMHCGSTKIFEGEIPFEDFVENVRSKLPLVPRYTQKIVFDPFNLAHPSWERDENFDIKNHIFRLEIDAPGTEKELAELASRIMTPLMNRNQPLWDIFLVYGLQDGNSAMIARVHHCMIDGVSGVDLIKLVLDLSPEVKPIIPPIESAETPVTAPKDLTKRYFDSLVSGYEEGMKNWLEYQKGQINLTKSLSSEENQSAARLLAYESAKLAEPIDILPFNQPSSGEKSIAWTGFSFAEARAIRAALKVTVNDVALTILSGAVSRYVESHGQKLLGRKVRVMVPVSLRQEDQHGTLGNLVSALPVEIPLDISHPIRRLKHINQKTTLMKNGKLAEQLNLYSALMGTMPPSALAFSAAVTNVVIPPINMVATNVPGPQVPLYAMGKKMLTYYPHVPVGQSLGVTCGIMSYNQNLYFGLMADKKAMADVENLRDFLNESFIELRTAAGVAELKPTKIKNRETSQNIDKSKSKPNKSPKSASKNLKRITNK